MALGEAEAAAAGRRRGPDRQALALGEGDRGVPGAGWRRCRGRRRGPGWRRRRGARRAPRTASGSATARPSTWRAIAARGVGLVDLGVPVVHRQRDEDRAARRQRRRGGRRGRAPAARPRPAAARRLHLTSGCGIRVASRLVRFACRVIWARACWPAVISSGEWFAWALKIAPIALPTPGAVWRLTTVVRPGGLGVAVGHPDHDRLLQARARSGSRSGKSASIGSSVEPGLPNIVVIPWARKRSKAGFADGRHRNRTLSGRVRSYLNAGATPGRIQGRRRRTADKAGVSHRLLATAWARALASSPLSPRAAAGGLRLRRGGAAGRPGSPTRRARSSRSRPRSRTKKATWSTSGSSPTCAGSPQRYPIYITDGYSGPLPDGEHVGCNSCHVKHSDHYNGLAVDIVPLDRELANATPTGAGSPASPSGPSPTEQTAAAVPLGRLRRRRRPRLRQPPPPLLEPRRRADVPARRMGRSLGRSTSPASTRRRARNRDAKPKAPAGPPGGVAQAATGGLSARRPATDRSRSA